MFLVILFLASVESSREPERIKLSWTGVEGEIMVTWVTYEEGDPELFYTYASDSSWKKVFGTQTSFKEGFFRSMKKNSALMKGLKLGESYKYYVGSFPYYSDIITISVPTPTNTTSIPFKFAVFGDWGTGSRGKSTLEALIDRKDFDGVFLFGDLAYNMDIAEGEHGDVFFREIEPITSTVPFMVIPGNHDVYRNFSQVTGRFSMPSNAYNEGTGLFFSLNLGLAHIVMYNTEYYFEDMKDSVERQLNFLKEDLKKANENRENQPWIIVMSHHPLYCSLDWARCHGEAQELRDSLEELFHTYKVDLSFAGHNHVYERDTAVYKNLTAHMDYEEEHTIKNANATVYITSGISGNIEGTYKFPENMPEWKRVTGNEYGYGMLTFINRTTILFEQFVSSDNSLYDHLYLIKDS